MQEIGESRETWGKAVWAMAEDFANHMKSETRPFYIVYACKYDPVATKQHGKSAFKQVMKAYYAKPPTMLGILVWYVDNREGKFEFLHELSAPPDVPLDPKLLSDRPDDTSARIASQGERLNALVS